MNFCSEGYDGSAEITAEAGGICRGSVLAEGADIFEKAETALCLRPPITCETGLGEGTTCSFLSPPDSTFRDSIGLGSIWGASIMEDLKIAKGFSNSAEPSV